jgi:antitoxin component YwqK of YwqJK toxin-antitoxin module
MQDKISYNEKGEAHGYWELYYPDGQLEHKGLYINGNRFGYHESYFEDGNLYYKGNFIDGEKYGYFKHHWGIKLYYAR